MNKRGMALIALMSMVPLDEAEELLSRNFSFEQEDTYNERYPLYYEGNDCRCVAGSSLYPDWDDGNGHVCGLV